MTALITLSHGSRHARAHDGIRRLTARAGAELGVDAVDAHLEFTTPDLAGAVETLRDAGHSEAIVVPLLFTRAFHATHDVPAALEAASGAGVTLTLAEGLGQGGDVVKLLAARVPDDAHTILYPVGTSNAAAAEATLRMGERLAETTGQAVTVVPATGCGETTGNEGIAEVAARHARVHLLPLFVTEGLLLDRAVDVLDEIQQVTGSTITRSEPLGTDLSEIIAARYRAARTESTGS
ncbi:sirohydrochlorin chelatase [Corynebacterium senegalense]|uniref:sirohydrochlorin chelatase n=1 Tax=Corynebacterium senegalense TaxID=2080750 RepID=UPI000E20430B|nr:sirohydrochlorin chelatase [Corynebacterium senegalense]